MAVANALGQRGSKCVTAAPWKSPLMAWRTVCDDYFRVADHPPGTQFNVLLPKIGYGTPLQGRPS
jgi:hypothetical protein